MISKASKKESVNKIIIMKNYIVIALYLFTNLCIAQPPILDTYSLANPNHEKHLCLNGTYFKDTANERDQYVGTWEYNQNNVLFQIKLEKVDQHLTESTWKYYYTDIISIKYRLVKNGVEIFNNLNSTPAVISEGVKQGSDEYLNCGFIDYTQNVSVLVHIKKLPSLQGGPQWLEFKLFTGAYRLLNPSEYYQPGVNLFNVPTEPIQMLKIN